MIRFGVVGTSWITTEFIKCANEVEGFCLNAVYSRSEEKSKSFAEKYSVKNVFTDLECMAKSDCIDAIYIASPNSLHASQSIFFMKNNKHVLCEKPIVSNVKELKEMIKTSKENKVLLMEAMKSTFLPNMQVIKDNLHKIGNIRRYFASYCQYSSRYDLYKEGKNPNTFNPEFSNGSTMDIGIYCVYPMIYLFGKPKSINANAFLLDSGVDGEGSIIAKYDNMDGVIMHSKIADSSISSEIQGEKGNIIIDKIHTPGNIKIVYRTGEVEDLTVEQSNNTMYYETKEFIELIEKGEIESKINSFENSINVAEILEASRSQTGVKFPADN